MSYFDPLCVRRQSLEERLNRPRLACARASPQQCCRLQRRTLLDQGSKESLLEFQAAAHYAGRIAGLTGLPAVRIAGLEPGFRIAGLPGLESAVLFHSLRSRIGSTACPGTALLPAGTKSRTMRGRLHVRSSRCFLHAHPGWTPTREVTASVTKGTSSQGSNGHRAGCRSSKRVQCGEPNLLIARLCGLPVDRALASTGGKWPVLRKSGFS